jgi:hypothetical protein
MHNAQCTMHTARCTMAGGSGAAGGGNGTTRNHAPGMWSRNFSSGGTEHDGW